MKTIIKVNINDRDFNMACDEGQEDRLRSLGKDVDDRIRDIKSKVGGAINESMLFVMVSIMLADELRDALAGKGNATPVLSSEEAAAPTVIEGLSQEEADAQITEELLRVAEKLEKLAA
jgi:cell division protein ZapA